MRLHKMIGMFSSKCYRPRAGFMLIGRTMLLVVIAVAGGIVILTVLPSVIFDTNPPAEAKIEFELGPSLVSGTIHAGKFGNFDQYKVVAYVKTDVWYIHPWDGAFAPIRSDGSWELVSVGRTPLPTQIGVFLVERDHTPPPVVHNLVKDLHPISQSLLPIRTTMKEDTPLPMVTERLR